MNSTPASPVDEVTAWGTPFAAAAVVQAGEAVATAGDTGQVAPLASITKLLSAWAVLVAVEEGAVALDDPVGQPGCTLGLLLCHAGGYDFDTPRALSAPGSRRIYSSSGYELAASHVEAATGFAFADYLAEAVLQPLGMATSELRGSPAADAWSSVDDLVRFVGELRSPTLLDLTTATQFRTVQLPDVAGVLPGWGRFDPLPWGFGPELRGTKSPSWMGSTAPASCFGHFGGAGTLLWVDPVTSSGSDLAAVALTDHEFGDWAIDAWPGWSDRVRAAYS